MPPAGDPQSSVLNIKPSVPSPNPANLNEHLNLANSIPPGQAPAPNVTASPDQTGVDAQQNARLAELETRNRQLEDDAKRYRGQASQLSKSEQEARDLASKSQAEMIASQKELAEAMQAMARSNTPDPNAITDDDLAVLGQDNVSAIEKLIHRAVSPFRDEIERMNAERGTTENITEGAGAVDEDRVRLIAAQQTMMQHPDVLNAQRHPQWPGFIKTKSVDMPDSTYEELVNAYHHFGQQDSFTNIHTRFLQAVQPQPAQAQGSYAQYNGMVPPQQSGARPESNRLGSPGAQGVPEHLTQEFLEAFARGEKTMDDVKASRERSARNEPQGMTNNPNTEMWVR